MSIGWMDPILPTCSSRHRQLGCVASGAAVHVRVRRWSLGDLLCMALGGCSQKGDFGSSPVEQRVKDLAVSLQQPLARELVPALGSTENRPPRNQKQRAELWITWSFCC